jgi:hypothetical protein
MGKKMIKYFFRLGTEKKRSKSNRESFDSNPGVKLEEDVQCVILVISLATIHNTLLQLFRSLLLSDAKLVRQIP